MNDELSTKVFPLILFWFWISACLRLGTWPSTPSYSSLRHYSSICCGDGKKPVWPPWQCLHCLRWRPTSRSSPSTINSHRPLCQLDGKSNLVFKKTNTIRLLLKREKSWLGLSWRKLSQATSIVITWNRGPVLRRTWSVSGRAGFCIAPKIPDYFYLR